MKIRDNDLNNGVILEEIRDQNKAILEGLQPIPGMAKDIGQLKDDVAELKTDVKAIQAVVKDHSRQLASHETRLTKLETA